MSLSLVVLAVFLTLPARASAELLRLVDAEISIEIVGLRPPGIGQAAATEVAVSSGGGFTLPADLFVGTAQLTPFFFTGAELISTLNVSLTAQSPLLVTAGGAGSGCFRAWVWSECSAGW